MAYLAYLEPLPENGRNRRIASRRKLSLGSTLSASGAEVVIHNLSSTGLLIETSADLRSGETIEVHMPETAASQATVIWCSEPFYGCQFEHQIPVAAVSAALLRSQIVSGPPPATVVRAQKEFASADTSPDWQDSAVEFRHIKREIGFVAPLFFGVLTYVILTGDVITALIIAAIVGVLFSIVAVLGL
jgi:hypothetical protein